MAKHRAVNLGKCKLTLSLAIQLMLYSFTFWEVICARQVLYLAYL